MTKDGLWPAPIVTKLLPLAKDGAAQFWSAEVGGALLRVLCCGLVLLHSAFSSKPPSGVHPPTRPPPNPSPPPPNPSARAQKYHHDYFTLNPGQPYCRFVVEPKVAKFRAKWAAKLIKA